MPKSHLNGELYGGESIQRGGGRKKRDRTMTLIPKNKRNYGENPKLYIKKWGRIWGFGFKRTKRIIGM